MSSIFANAENWKSKVFTVGKDYAMTNRCWCTLNVYIIKDKCHRETGGPGAFHSVLFALRIKLINVLLALILNLRFTELDKTTIPEYFFLGLVPLNKRTSNSARKAQSCSAFTMITISFFIYNCVDWPGYRSQPVLLLLAISPLFCPSQTGRQTQFDCSRSDKITRSVEVAHWTERNNRSTQMRAMMVSLATQFDPKKDIGRGLTVPPLSAFSG